MFNEYDDMVTVEEMQKMIGVGKNTADTSNDYQRISY